MLTDCLHVVKGDIMLQGIVSVDVLSQLKDHNGDSNQFIY